MSAPVPLWISIATLLVGAVTAGWNIIRDRNMLGRLERVTTITSHLTPGTRPFAMMRDLQDRLAVHVALTTEAPPHRARLVTGWVLLVVGFGVAVGWVAFGIITVGPGAWRYPIVWGPYAAGLVVAFIGQGVLVFREMAITAWKDTRFTEYAVDENVS